MATDSQDQEALFRLTQVDNDGIKIIAEIERQLQLQRDLTWFQDIIPALVPGIEDDSIWLPKIRSMLWTLEHNEKHKTICNRRRTLQRSDPAPPHVHRFGLKRYWPVCVKFLQPMSTDMEKAVNAVSRSLNVSNCYQEKSLAQSEIPGNMYHSFVISRQVMQDKMLNPLLRSLDSIEKATHADLARLEEAIQFQAEEMQTEESDQETRRLQKEHEELQQVARTDSQLKSALQSLQIVIIRERDLIVQDSSKKRSYPDVDTWTQRRLCD